MTTVSLAEAAHKYRDLGISVLPIAAGTKLPDQQALTRSRNLIWLGQPSWGVFTRRFASDEEINTWFANNTGSLGIVTGFRQLLVLDFDRPASYQAWLESYGDLAAQTSIQKTPRGFHVLFRWNGIRSILLYKNNGFQLLSEQGTRVGELKGARDYVVAWPSIHPNGEPYQWLPGQAPWETPIARIESLREIGVGPSMHLIGGYLASIPGMFANPRQKIPFVLNKLGTKYRYLAGIYFRK